MASANHDANHLKLSRKLKDPVAAAATDGSEVSSSLRNDYLNRANSFIQLAVWTVDKSEEKLLVQQFLPGLIATSAITFDSSGASVASDHAFALSCQKDTGNVRLYQVFPTQEIDTANDDATFLNASFLVRGGKVYAYQNGAQLTSGAGTLYYVKNDQRASAGDSSDILIDSIWYHVLVDIAATYHYEDKDESLDLSDRRWKLVKGLMGIQ